MAMDIQIPNAQNIFDVDVGKLLSHVVADIGIGVAITDARCIGRVYGIDLVEIIPNRSMCGRGEIFQ